MEPRRAAVCATLLATLTHPAAASSHWLCSVSTEGTRLICVSDAGPAEEPTPANSTTTAIVNGTRFPLDTARQYTIDMWSPPTDPEFVALLARSSMCYRSPGCQVSMVPGPWMPAMARR
jgi:hypothetical protein